MKRIIFALTMLFAVAGCQTAEQDFIDNHIKNICNEAYAICNREAGCELGNKEYIEGSFPGARRVVIITEERNTTVQVRIFLKSTVASGTTMQVQIYESDCIIDKENGQELYEDVDLFKEAGDDRTLIYNLLVKDSGEHLLEIFSDASAEYLLIAEQKRD